MSEPKGPFRSSAIKNIFQLMLFFALPLAGALPAIANTLLVVPNAQAASSGNSPTSFGTSATEFQEVLGSGQFTTPIDIYDILFRASAGAGPLSFSYSSFEITLSTTTAYPNTNGPDTLPSTTYASNVGPDKTIVFDGPLSLTSPGCAGPAPCPFDIVIPLSTPFSYDPSTGRLLMDIVTSAANGSPTGDLDGESYTDSTLSKIAYISGPAGDATGTLGLGGLVVGLESPEPASLLLLLSAAAAFLWRQHLRSQPQRSSGRDPQ